MFDKNVICVIIYHIKRGIIMKTKRNIESELYALVKEYKRLFGIANSISNESVL